MTLERPTRKELVQKIQAAIESRLSFDQLRRSDAKIYARAFAGVADAVYSLVTFMHRQQFAYSAEAEYLERRASLYGIRRIPAVAAAGYARFDVSAGGAIPSGTYCQSSEGVQYVTEGADVAGLCRIVATVPGAGGNLAAGAAVSLVSPIEGVAIGGAVTSDVSGGVDIESDDSLRSRTLIYMREAPMGGSSADYKTWALEVPGVTRAWVYGQENGSGTVVVRFVCDNQQDSIIPSAEMVQRVQAHIDEERPVTATVSVVAPVAMPVPITFASFVGEDSAKAVVEADLKRLFATEAQPGVMLPLSHIRAAISNATGEQDFVLSSPTANISPATGRIPVLGAITWP